ncbi:class I SAM-dependent methyltransferase [Rhizobium binxianense]
MSIRKFIFRDLKTVDGYIDPPDALVFLCLLEAQRKAGLKGGIAEIGVFYGRSYFLFKRIGGEGERIVAIDLFDIGQKSEPGKAGGISPQYRKFLENGRRLGIAVDEELVIKADSTRLDASDIVGKAGRIRFFSIDGGHMLAQVAADSRLAMHSLAEHGIIAFDDTFNPAWPEVTIGVADFLREHADSFAAFCMTKYRTYVCRHGFHDFYHEAIATAPALGAFEHSETKFLASPVIRLHNPFGRRVLYELMTRTGMSALSERIYR